MCSSTLTINECAYTQEHVLHCFYGSVILTIYMQHKSTLTAILYVNKCFASAESVLVTVRPNLWPTVVPQPSPTLSPTFIYRFESLGGFSTICKDCFIKYVLSCSYAKCYNKTPCVRRKDNKDGPTHTYLIPYTISHTSVDPSSEIESCVKWHNPGWPKLTTATTTFLGGIAVIEHAKWVHPRYTQIRR